jgi:hypothetical protein
MSRSLRGLSQEGVRGNSRYSGRILLSSAKRRPHAPVPGTERRHIDKTMVKAIARAFRWREMLENGTHATIAEIAAAEKINELRGSYPAADAAGAGYRRGHPGRAAANRYRAARAARTHTKHVGGAALYGRRITGRSSLTIQFRSPSRGGKASVIAP